MLKVFGARALPARLLVGIANLKELAAGLLANSTSEVSWRCQTLPNISSLIGISLVAFVLAVMSAYGVVAAA